MQSQVDRRHFLVGLAATGTSMAAAGPALAAPCNPPVSRMAPFAELVRTTPIIDIHCHIFNATDIPAYQFLHEVVGTKAAYEEYIRARKKQSVYQLAATESGVIYQRRDKAFGKLLRAIKDHEYFERSYPFDRMLLTPDYYQESALLKALLSQDEERFDDLEQRLLGAVLDDARRGNHENIDYMRQWARYTPVEWRNQKQVTPAELAAIVARMRKQNAVMGRPTAFLRNERGFISCMVKTRIENFTRLRDTYRIAGAGPEAKPRFFAPALVDFDYWLDGPAARGAKPNTPSLIAEKGANRPHFGAEKTTIDRQRTTLAQQIELMGQITRMFPAECHSYFPFCPWRQVDATHSGTTPPLQLLERAIKDHGFIGVKLYPPMGFRPLDNTLVSRHPDIVHHMFPAHLYDAGRFPYLPKKKAGQSDRDWKFTVSEAFGKLLDDALQQLYTFCIKHNLPIMTHAGASNFSGGYDFTNDEGKLAHNFYSEKGAIPYWAKLVADPPFAGLRLNLAHAGFREATWREALSVILRQSNHVYADISYFEHILSGPSKDKACDDAVEDARNLKVACDAGLWQRFMYGSDWYMMTLEDHSENYLNVFVRILYEHVIDGRERIFKAVMAGNASRFLGLDLPENSNYERLTAFYDRSFGTGSKKALAARDRLNLLADIGRETAAPL